MKKGLLLFLLVCISQVYAFDSREYLGAFLLTESQDNFRQAWQHSDLGLVILDFPSQANVTSNAISYHAFEELLQHASVTNLWYSAANPFFLPNGDLLFSECNRVNEEEEICSEFIMEVGSSSAKSISYENIPKKALRVRKAKLCWDYIKGDWLKCASKMTAPFKITIDPGHGGSDPGAIGHGYQEKAFTLDVSIRLRDLLNGDRGLWQVQMTRSTDVDVSLSARCNMANNWPADRFVSIHINSFSSSSAQGTETYSYQEGTTAANMRDRIQTQMIAAWGLVNRGSKTENFQVLRDTSMPASLSELGFITSPVDIVYLSNANSRQQAARAHLVALQQHFGVFVAEQEEEQTPK